MTNSNSDKQLERMQYLMGYKATPIKENKCNIEYHVIAADGKAYGIIKEGNMYYIKSTTPENEMLKESYDYIGGYNYRNENGYKSYNEATKHLELKLMSINESCGKHEDVSVVLNPNKGKEDMKTLTEAARKELDRMKQIFENSSNIGVVKNIGNHGNPEGKGTATNPAAQSEPFTEKAEATLDKDPKTNGTVEGATPDNTKVGEPKMDSTNNPKCKGGKCGEKNKNVKSDLEGDELASAKGKVNKGVVKESCFEDDENELGNKLVGINDESELDPIDGDEFSDEDSELPGEIEGDELSADDFNTEDEFAGENEPMDELDELLEDFMGGDTTEGTEGDVVTEEDKIVGPDKVMDGPHGTDGKDAEWERIDEDETQEAKQGNEETLKSYQRGGNLPVQSWDKLNESIDRIVESVCGKLGAKKTKKKETLKEAVDRIVAEEITRLNVFGKHPRYGKQPMTLPDNKEVLAGTADKDWNDDSTKGSEQYGKKIGSSAPFDKVVDILTDNVMKQLKESVNQKKKSK